MVQAVRNPVVRKYTIHSEWAGSKLSVYTVYFNSFWSCGLNSGIWTIARIKPILAHPSTLEAISKSQGTHDKSFPQCFPLLQKLTGDWCLIVNKGSSLPIEIP